MKQAQQNISSGARNASESFNRFVEGQQNIANTSFSQQHPHNNSSAGQTDELGRPVSGMRSTRSNTGASVDPDKQDFWDSFGSAPKGPEREKKDFWDNFGGASDMGSAGSKSGPPAEKKGFWDEFSDVGKKRSSVLGSAGGGGGGGHNRVVSNSSVGTSAMKGAEKKKDDEDWGENW